MSAWVHPGTECAPRTSTIKGFRCLGINMHFVFVGFYPALCICSWMNTYSLQVVQQIALLILDFHRFLDWKVGC